MVIGMRPYVCQTLGILATLPGWQPKRKDCKSSADMESSGRWEPHGVKEGGRKLSDMGESQYDSGQGRVHAYCSGLPAASSFDAYPGGISTYLQSH